MTKINAYISSNETTKLENDSQNSMLVETFELLTPLITGEHLAIFLRIQDGSIRRIDEPSIYIHMLRSKQ